MIADKELRDLFKIECAEHIQALEKGLLCLEKETGNNAILEEVFREAHSLKGAARMVGVRDVEAVGHRIEDIFGSVRKGDSALTSEGIDRIYHALDAVKKLVNEAVTGEHAGVDVSEVIAQIKGEVNEEVRNQKLEARSQKIEDRSKESTPPQHLEIEKFRIETVRVDTKILDMLMTQAGELMVTKTHIARRLSEIEEISEVWESLEGRIQNTEFIIQKKGIPDSGLKSRIQNLKRGASEDSARLDFIAEKIEDGIRKIRLIPLSAIFNLYPRMARDMAKGQSKDVELIIEGDDTAADKRIIEEMKDPIMHMIRNAIDHGIEMPAERERLGKPHTGKVMLKAYQTESNIVIEVSDDGKGLDTGAIRETAQKKKIHTEDELSAMIPSQLQSLIFSSGFSTSTFVTDVSGRGVGLDVVRANVERLKGTVTVESSPVAGCRFRVQLPVTLTTIRVLITGVGGMPFAIPVENIETSRMIGTGEIFYVAGRMTVIHEGEAVSVARLADLLELRNSESGIQKSEHEIHPEAGRTVPCIILSVNKERIGLLVDSLIDEQTVIIKPKSTILSHVRNVFGATILATGEVCMVLNPQDLLKSISSKSPLMKREAPEEVPETKPVSKKTILLVEDSITTRTQEKRILEGAGYEVVAAVNGVDGWARLQSRRFDAVVTDIMMPEMDGLTLTAKIREDKRFKEIPVILVTTLASDEDKKKGLDAGANAYIPKPAFDQKMFLEIIGRLL